ncbi:MAG: PA2778 family cysteine peptidase [Pseudomonadota bacterium]
MRPATWRLCRRTAQRRPACSATTRAAGRQELEQTPFFPQSRYQCGPAALATVLTARGVAVTPAALTERVYVPALHGSLRAEMTATARHFHMLAYPLRASLADLLTEIAHGNPVLVFQNLGLQWLPRRHYAVAIGYDLETGEIILRSGTTRRWRTTLATFERTWARGDYWALVILPAGEMPATAQPESYLQAAHDLEADERNLPAAHAAYAAAIRRWPQLPLAWMAYGNDRYSAGDMAAAARSFRQVTQLAPADANGWNNLAYALQQSGCPQQALRAARCAVSLAPAAAGYRDTLADMVAGAQGSDGAHCAPVRCDATTTAP